MKIIFYNAHLVDADTDCNGALLVQNEKIIAVIHGDFSDAEKASNLAKLFSDTELCADGKNQCKTCKTQCQENDDHAVQFVNCGGKTLMPSFIDMHVHFRYPGQTQKEDLESGTNAAAAGGYGTVVLMPNTNPVVSSDELSHSIESKIEELNKIQAIQSVSLTKDFDGKTTNHIDNLSRVPLLTEDGHDVQDSLVMLDAMSKAAVKGAIVSCHCEDDSFTMQAKNLRKSALAHYKKFDESNKTDELEKELAETEMQQANELLAMAEDLATERNLELAEEAGCRIHIAHVSTAKSIQAVRNAKLKEASFGRYGRITCEVTPHHFGLNAETGENLRLIVNPPLRSENDRQKLLKAFADGTVDVISTDHAPHTIEDKLNGAPGFSGLETAFSVANTMLVEKGIISLKKLSALMSANPAHILGLDIENEFQCARGKLECGMLANLVIADTNEEWTVDSSKFKTKGNMCPFENMELTGKIKETWFCGKRVF